MHWDCLGGTKAFQGGSIVCIIGGLFGRSGKDKGYLGESNVGNLEREVVTVRPSG